MHSVESVVREFCLATFRSDVSTGAPDSYLQIRRKPVICRKTNQAPTRTDSTLAFSLRLYAIG
jgi:hypothetical protein